MAKLSKRVKAFKEKVDPAKNYPVSEAVAILNELSSVKFKESIDVSVNLGVDPRKSDQVVRGATRCGRGQERKIGSNALSNRQEWHHSWRCWPSWI